MMLIGSQAVEKVDQIKRSRITSKVEMIKLLKELEEDPKVPAEDVAMLRAEVNAYGGTVTLPGVGTF